MGLRDVFIGADQIGREHCEEEHWEQLEQRQRGGQKGVCGQGKACHDG